MIAIRLALTCVLLYFVYGETGWATTYVLAMVALRFELDSWMLHDRRLRKIDHTLSIADKILAKYSESK